MILLAVDGGNSKTDVVLLDGDGELLGFVRGAQCSPERLGLEGAVEGLQALVGEVGLDGRRVEFAEVLLAGVDFPDQEEEALAALEACGWATRTEIANDTFAVLRAGTDRSWGVAVTCGAGINCVGVGPDGRRVRFPALGAITGDWGGGYDVGLAALSAAARSADGRGPKTALERLVPAHFGFESPTDVARAIRGGELDDRRAIELAPIVLSMTDDDPVAAAIEQRLADEIVAFARAALARLDWSGLPVDVVVGGGLMRAARPRLLARIESGLEDSSVAATLRRTLDPLIVGASLLALDRVDAGDGARKRARDELVGAVTAYERMGG